VQSFLSIPFRPGDKQRSRSFSLSFLVGRKGLPSAVVGPVPKDSTLPIGFPAEFVLVVFDEFSVGLVPRGTSLGVSLLLFLGRRFVVVLVVGRFGFRGNVDFGSRKILFPAALKGSVPVILLVRLVAIVLGVVAHLDADPVVAVGAPSPPGRRRPLALLGRHLRGLRLPPAKLGAVPVKAVRSDETKLVFLPRNAPDLGGRCGGASPSVHKHHDGRQL